MVERTTKAWRRRAATRKASAISMTPRADERPEGPPRMRRLIFEEAEYADGVENGGEAGDIFFVPCSGVRKT